MFVVWLIGDSKPILVAAGCNLFGIIADVEVAEVTTTELDVLELVVLDVVDGCKITNVAPEVDDDCIRGKL